MMMDEGEPFPYHRFDGAVEAPAVSAANTGRSAMSNEVTQADRDAAWSVGVSFESHYDAEKIAQAFAAHRIAAEQAAADALEAKDAEIARLEEELAIAQDYKDCACSYDKPNDICLGHKRLFERIKAPHHAAEQAAAERERELVEVLAQIAGAMEYPNQLECGFVHGKPTFKDMKQRVEIASSIARQALAKYGEQDD